VDIHERGARPFIRGRRRTTTKEAFAMERNRISAVLATCIAAGALLPSFAAAEETKVLHKCVDAKGLTSIQANPCAKGTTEVWSRPAQTEAKPTEADIAAARERDARNREEVARQSAELQRRIAPTPPTSGAPGSQLAGTPTEGTHLANTPTEGTHLANTPSEGSQMTPVRLEDEAPPPPVGISNCQAAQSFASAVREKSWIGLTDDQIKRVYGWVQDQCRVKTASDQ
jgi:type II secretory pathway pseudopilin PulG